MSVNFPKVISQKAKKNQVVDSSDILAVAYLSIVQNKVL